VTPDEHTRERILTLLDEFDRNSTRIRALLALPTTANYEPAQRLANAVLNLPGRGRTISDLNLLQIAACYSWMAGHRGIYPRLADELGCSEDHARNLVHQARKVGYLEPTVQGKANFNLTLTAVAAIENWSGSKSLLRMLPTTSMR